MNFILVILVAIDIFVLGMGLGAFLCWIYLKDKTGEHQITKRLFLDASDKIDELQAKLDILDMEVK